jgi:hypothetical protein
MYHNLERLRGRKTLRQASYKLVLAKAVSYLGKFYAQLADFCTNYYSVLTN